MGLDHILWTTQNKSFWAVSFKAGAHSESISSLIVWSDFWFWILVGERCTAHPQSIDTGSLPCSKRHTNALVALETPKVLWERYGIIDGITVCNVFNPRTFITDCAIQPFTDAFPHADIYELIMPDLLHQIIKGTFKDHLVTWVEEYLILTHGQTCANTILDDIDGQCMFLWHILTMLFNLIMTHRICIVPSFPGLRRFPQGRGFKQWTGDDSKALMKVCLYSLFDA